MGRTKLKKFIELKSFPNVFDQEQEMISGNLKKYFANENSYTLEVGCGEGDYTVNLAKQFSDKNFIGIDIKQARLYVGAKKALENNINNAAFISARVEKLTDVFKENEVEEIYIPFPEPHVRRRSIPRRLVSPEMLNVYKNILRSDGRIHFKTDDKDLFEYSLEVISKAGLTIIKQNPDVHSQENLTLAETITTRYERYYKREGRNIHYVCFRF